MQILRRFVCEHEEVQSIEEWTDWEGQHVKITLHCGHADTICITPEVADLDIIGNCCRPLLKKMLAETVELRAFYDKHKDKLSVARYFEWEGKKTIQFIGRNNYQISMVLSELQSKYMREPPENILFQPMLDAVLREI